jgi:hypothetical protein
VTPISVKRFWGASVPPCHGGTETTVILLVSCG